MKIMHRYFAFVCCLLALLVVTACGTKSVEEVEEEIKKGQTIVVFMPWSGNQAGNNSLYGSFLTNLAMMSRAVVQQGGLGQSRIMIYIERDAVSGELMEMVYENNEVSYKSLKNYGAPVATRTGGMSSLFSEIIDLAPAYHYGMIIGGHGCGWTYFDNWSNYPYRMPMRIGTETRSFGSVTSSSHAFSVESVADALLAAGIHLDFLLFDVCYMANVETVYALRHVSDYVIASTSEVLSSGMPYEQMLPLLMGTPDYDAACREFYQYYSNYTYPYGSIATVDCRYLERLASAMKGINNYALSTDYDLSSIQVLDGFSPCLFYDLVDYVDHACTDESLKEFFHQEMDLVVPYKYYTPKMVTALVGVRTIDVHQFCGLSISDPSQNHIAVDGRTRTEWYQATH